MYRGSYRRPYRGPYRRPYRYPYRSVYRFRYRGGHFQIGALTQARYDTNPYLTDPCSTHASYHRFLGSEMG